MITFGQLGTHGRLGNQLFQYAALKSLGLKKGYQVKIPYLPRATWHGQGCLLNNFNLEAEYLVPDDIHKIQFQYTEPNHNAFDETFFSLGDNTSIHGFFQFTDYFKDYESELRREFTPKKNFIDASQKILDPFRTGGYEVVSVHIRRGDMMTHMYTDTGVSPYEVFGREDIFDSSTIFGRYLTEAIKHFEGQKVKFLVFAGGKRDGDDSEDIAYIKKVINRDDFYISESNDPMLDFVTIMSCDHNITCHQSSYGWWAAHLNDNPHKIVTSPENYFFLCEETNKRTKKGHFPDGWKIV